jgi:hypothetical protein
MVPCLGDILSNKLLCKFFNQPGLQLRVVLGGKKVYSFTGVAKMQNKSRQSCVLKRGHQ